ncbi:DUF1796 family putative cysteine peptidase [Paenibacillus sp. Soil787]|uniref:DUF1796 family putative cysteine peptidase n=1 Tax=Paenibacillus sp. Soil787 TaxID=1736411 RepID=UPI000703A06E|nr:DUF1796 family putative cysteine peptidase [Paenibacillus sp. Soil787]KRF18677.1 hypothetical protein ASG93_11645 [Paenibacillus sp. Soil787]
MHLLEIKKSYDVVVSLGCNCATAYHLKRHNLRRFSSPLDWMKSPTLSDVTRMLMNQFNGFMEIENLCLMGNASHVVEGFENDEVRPNHIATYEVKDVYYNINSYHDFIAVQNQDWSITYPAVKEKFNRRVNRFQEKIIQDNSILFVRLGATIDETIELQSVLSKLTKGQFHILIVNLGQQSVVIEKDWEIDKVCSVQIPNFNGEDGVYSAWDTILDGITIKE